MALSEYVLDARGKRMNEERLNTSGVWIMVGKEKETGKKVCLQVAKTSNLRKEIEEDIKLLSYRGEGERKQYLTYFSGDKYSFDYIDYPDARFATLYRKINDEYEDVSFIVLATDLEVRERTMLEKYAAFKTMSRFWVSGNCNGKCTEEERLEEIYRLENSPTLNSIKGFESIMNRLQGLL